jgi:steroid 5-alpha reductase family enzyme
MLEQLLIAWAGLSAALWLLWWWQTRSHDASSVDAAWALGIGACAVWYAASGDGDPARRWLVAALIGVWALRLGLHLVLDRVLRASAEDGRYAAMRAHWGASANAHFAWFYQAQALAALLFSWPFLVAAHDPRPLGLSDVLALAWWASTLAMVTVADRQLARWRADPAHQGRTCRSGWWRYSRHPNYFFEWLHWFAYVALAWGGPGGPWTFAIPALLLVLLLFVTGIPYVEARALKTRGDDYRRYQRETSVFVPLPVRQTSG